MSTNGLHKIRIEAGETVRNGYKVFIDEVQIRGVTRVKLDLGVDQWPTVELTILGETLETNGIAFAEDEDE